MQKHYLQRLLTGMLVSLSLWSTVADAIIFNLDVRKNKPKITILVGDPGEGKGRVNLVTFTVPASQLGNGTPVTGSSTVPIHVVIQATAANPLTGYLTVDSFSKPLTNDSSASTIPFSEISWDNSENTIPAGSFDGSPNQPIISFQSSRGYSDSLIFSYANTMLIEHGTYKGSVRYTWAIP
jgi:hypothetical protein